MLLQFLFCITASSNSETIKVKTFLIEFEDRERIDPYEYYQLGEFVLKFQWEPEGLYLITTVSTKKNDISHLIDKVSPFAKYTIANPTLRDLPKTMFNKF